MASNHFFNAGPPDYPPEYQDVLDYHYTAHLGHGDRLINTLNRDFNRFFSQDSQIDSTLNLSDGLPFAQDTTTTRQSTSGYVAGQDSFLDYQSASHPPYYDPAPAQTSTVHSTSTSSVLFAPAHIAHPTSHAGSGPSFSFPPQPRLLVHNASHLEPPAQTFHSTASPFVQSHTAAHLTSNFIGGQQGQAPFLHPTNQGPIGPPFFLGQLQPEHAPSLPLHTLSAPVLIPQPHATQSTSHSHSQDSFLVPVVAPGQPQVVPEPPLHFSLCPILMKALADHNVKNWVTVIKGASAILCVILCESSSASVRERAANKALTESIFNCAKESSNHTWSLENVQWTRPGVRTTRCDKVFSAAVMNALLLMPKRYFRIVWIKAKRLIQNQTGFNGLTMHNYGIFGGNIPINVDLIKWWCMFNNDHGYGIFHGPSWATGSIELGVPFGHAAFAMTFQIAAYGPDEHSLHFIDKKGGPLTSDVSLSMGATICGWLIPAANNYRNTDLVPSCSKANKQAIKATIQKVYNFFVKVMDGLPGKSPEEQDMWRSGLTNFLRKNIH